MSDKPSVIKTMNHIGVVEALGLIFITLKLCDQIDWPWWQVLAPFWIPLAIVGVLIAAMGVIAVMEKRP